ncbi:xylose operon transcription regulator XylR [Rhodopirellula sp. SWK7]|uniref:AraC family transcriptional regulator n=1 Tax=Rhodopirellula sp. SWK7 TaxID=595460 RepID=UPI0002C01DF2|nr:DNA-binding transcriptional regulator [Rhodopirellula sp. SWK7]EMI46868.1 xylose operon regulatory protein [Rhodopirellula sp. SWK7]
MAKKAKSVALLIESSNSYSRGMLQGIAAYMHENEQWSIRLPEQERDAPPPSWLKDWKGDGIIARIENEQIADALRNTKVPVIDVSAARRLPKVPWVEIDEAGIAEAAFNHLRERGFENLAFCGETRFKWSELRQGAFVERAAQEGFACHVFKPPAPIRGRVSLDREGKAIAKWLKSLPRPAALLACYDLKARQILDICREIDLKVPEDLALLGVDNDEVLCDLATPPLSSVIPAAKKIGFAAAHSLDCLMKGEELDQHCRLIGPIGVATRQSTDILAIEDPDVAAALRFIRDHHNEQINVQDVMGVIPVSRRSLEVRFRKTVGRTIYQEIVRRRIDRICQLLNGSKLSLAQIAQRTGFESEEYMSVAFRRAKGMPPGRYRKSQF